MKKESDKNPFVAIPASLAGIFLVIVIMFLVLANTQIVLLTPIAWAFVVLGAAAMFFAYLSMKKK